MVSDFFLLQQIHRLCFFLKLCYICKKRYFLILNTLYEKISSSRKSRV